MGKILGISHKPISLQIAWALMGWVRLGCISVGRSYSLQSATFPPIRRYCPSFKPFFFVFLSLFKKKRYIALSPFLRFRRRLQDLHVRGPQRRGLRPSKAEPQFFPPLIWLPSPPTDMGTLASGDITRAFFFFFFLLLKEVDGGGDAMSRTLAHTPGFAPP